MSLFDHPAPHARITDPISSEVAVSSLGRDDALKARIVRALVSCSQRNVMRHYSDGDSIAVYHDIPVTDDHLLDYLERTHGRRFQRNVIARTRGLLEPDWVLRVPPALSPHRREVIAFVPTPLAVDYVYNYNRIHNLQGVQP